MIDLKDPALRQSMRDRLDQGVARQLNGEFDEDYRALAEQHLPEGCELVGVDSLGFRFMDNGRRCTLDFIDLPTD